MIIFNLWGSLGAVAKEAFDRHFCSGPILPDNTIIVMMMMMIDMIMMIIVLILRNMMMMTMMIKIMMMTADLSLFLK